MTYESLDGNTSDLRDGNIRTPGMTLTGGQRPIFLGKSDNQLCESEDFDANYRHEKPVRESNNDIRLSQTNAQSHITQSDHQYKKPKFLEVTDESQLDIGPGMQFGDYQVNVIGSSARTTGGFDKGPQNGIPKGRRIQESPNRDL
jgi:hypothetical protein